MGGDWKEYRFGDIATFSYGKMPKKNLRDTGNCPIFTGYKIAGTYPEYNCMKGTLIVVARGVGGTGDVKLAPENCYLTNLSIQVDPKDGFINKQFFYYKHLLSNLRHLDTGSAQSQITIRDLENLPIVLPPIHKQESIAHMLGTLDDKIELNRRMNETLESMAQALFKSWFVDFDPVIDNALAAGNDIPEALQERAAARQTLGDKRKPLPEEIQKLFPSSFEFSDELGWIPEGWGVQPLYDIANFLNGAAFKTKHFIIKSVCSLPIIKIAEIKNGLSSQTKFTNDRFDEKYLINDGEILLSWSGNPDTSIDTFVWCSGSGWLNQHIFKVSPISESERTYVYYQLKLLRPVLAEIARDKQTTGLGHFTIKDMKKLQVVRPSQELIEIFGDKTDSIFNKWYNNRLDCDFLSNLRDALLPKLLSGELRIPDAEKHIEEAV